MLIMHIGFYACFHAISLECSRFSKIGTLNFLPLYVALKLLVSLISRLVACSARIVVYRQTEKQTDTQTKYCNPRCACAPRVNYIHTYGIRSHIKVQNFELGHKASASVKIDMYVLHW